MPTFETIFAVDGNTQTIQTMSGGSIRAKSKHYFKAVFRFGTGDPFLELDYLSATFSPIPFERCRNGAYIVPLTAQERTRDAEYVAYECEIPWEVLTRKGKVYVGVFAGDMLVTNEAQIEITAAAPVLGADSQPTQSWWARFAAAIAQLTAALIGKQDKLTAGTNITIEDNVISATGGAAIQPYTNDPAMDGTASAGSSDAYARGDHVHPTDTSRVAVTDYEQLEYTVGVMAQGVQALEYAVGQNIRDIETLNSTKYAKPVGGVPKTDLAESVQSSLDKADSALQSHQSLAAYRTAAAQDVIDGAQDTAIAAKYAKPSGGIPKTDLASDVQTSLGKADTALQTAPVSSVNGQTGAVTLSIPSTAADVGAEPAVTEHTNSDNGAITGLLTAGNIYHFTGTLTSLTISFQPTLRVPHYHFDFNEGSTAFDPVLPNTVVLPDNHTWEADTHYEVDILNGYALVVGWAVTR